MKVIRSTIPLLVVLAALFILAYPIAFLLGYPLAKVNLENRNRWTQRVIKATPPLELSDSTTLRFSEALDPNSGLLVRDQLPLATAQYRVEHGQVKLLGTTADTTLARLEGVSDGVNRVFSSTQPDQAQPLYLNGRLLSTGYEEPPEKPDGQRLTFTFTDTKGVFALRGKLLRPGKDYTLEGHTLHLTQPAPLWLSLRAEPYWARPFRVTGDYAWADDHTIVLKDPPPPGSKIEFAEGVVRWAERLRGPLDGVNRTFTLAHGNVIPDDPTRRLFLNDHLLDAQGRSPDEPVDGKRVQFSFEKPGGLITLNGRLLTLGQEYDQQGQTITLKQPPARFSQLRQYDDLITNSEQGTVLLAQAPNPGSIVWTTRYTVYDRPQCGTTIFECFMSLPQHPMPFPNWIITRIPSFLTRYRFQSERNVLRETIYSAQGTLLALLLGGAVGLILAVLFVLIRPLERTLFPWVIVSQTVPIIALVPVLVLILANFGIRIQTSLLPSALIGGYLSFFPITVGATKGLRSVDPLALDLMRSYAASRRQVLLKVRIFEAMPYLTPTLKVGAAASLVGALISETETSNAKGLGYAILAQAQAGNVADLWILLLISSILGILLVSAVGWLANLIAPWVRKA